MTEPLDAHPASPPFTSEHASLRSSVRAWVGQHLLPFAPEWERAREFPRQVFQQAGDDGLLGWKYDASDGGCGPDPLADVVVTEELARCGSGGVAAGLGASKDLAPLYVHRFGTGEQRQRWLRPAVAGRAVTALAVTEPSAGSDVAALRTRASRDGDGWLLTGEKAFCTNGSRADWVLVAARTGEQSGPHALSLFVVDTATAGFQSSRIDTLGWRTSQTGLLSLTGVRVPAGALLGEPGSGFVMIMKSFQWERLVLALGAVSAAAANLASCREWATRGAAAQRWREQVGRLVAVRALTYQALTDHLAGREPLRQVSAAKWLGCDLDVDTALLRHQAAVAAVGSGGRPAQAAEQALRDARLGPIGGGAREVMADLVARALGMG